MSGEALAPGAATRIAALTPGRAVVPWTHGSRHPRRPVDRRLGLGRRRRDPGRPEGVRALRRARDDGDHRRSPRRTRVAVTRRHPVPADVHRRAGPRGRRRHRRRRREDRHARHRGDGRGGRRGARPARAGHAGRARPRDGRRVAAPRCSTTDARRALVDLLLPRATVITPNLPEARVLAGDGGARATSRSSPRALHALGPRRRGRHRRPPRRGDAIVLFDGDARPPDRRRRGIPTAPRTARAARTPRRSRRTWRSATRPLEAARAARAIAAEAVRDGLREIGAGPGPVDVLGLTAARPVGAPL